MKNKLPVKSCLHNSCNIGKRRETCAVRLSFSAKRTAFWRSSSTRRSFTAKTSRPSSREGGRESPRLLPVFPPAGWAPVEDDSAKAAAFWEDVFWATMSSSWAFFKLAISIRLASSVRLLVSSCVCNCWQRIFSWTSSSLKRFKNKVSQIFFFNTTT